MAKNKTAAATAMAPATKPEASVAKTEAGPASEPAAPRKRGAPKGVKRGPRQLFYVVQGEKDGSPFMDQIPAGNSSEASSKFEQLHGSKPIGQPLGAFYEQKGKTASARATIDINDLKFTGMQKVAEHRDWHCKVLLAENPTVGMVIYTNPVDPNSEKSARSRPNARPLLLSELENLRDA